MRLLVPHDWHVPSNFAKRLGDNVGRQRAMSAEGHLLLVLHEPPVVGVTERKGRFFWRDPDGAWRSKPLGDGPHALKRHMAEFAERVEELEKQWQTAGNAEDYYTPSAGPLQAACIAPFGTCKRRCKRPVNWCRTTAI